LPAQQGFTMNNALPTPAANQASAASSFQSVKLPATLVNTAKASAQTFRRSTAAQIEYWAILGKSLEAQGITSEEARVRVERSEVAFQTRNLIARFQAAEASGALTKAVSKVIAENEKKAKTNSARKATAKAA
jgi:Asp-tRNA(Asn)/Glu-tRNA(Gln) amidotransferase B subunit